MPHAILRALRHRSTPTLLPSTAALQSQSHRQEQRDHTPAIPSIFITVPDEEGAHHWCALAGTAPAFNGAGAHGFDVPLPDFAALEETIDRLKRAGETPTFRRPSPGRRDDVVLPKKKYADGHSGQHQHHHVHSHSGNSTGASTKRSRPKRPQTSPITRRERAQAEENNIGHDPFAASTLPRDREMLADAAEPATVTVPSGNGRFTPTSVLRGLNKSKKQKHRPPPVLTSASHESVVAQPFSAPAQYGTFPRNRTSQDSVPKQKKRSSLGWLFSSSSKRASVPVARHDIEALEMVVEHDANTAPHARRSYGSNPVASSTSQIVLGEQVVEYTMPACFDEDHADEPMSPAETHESDLDKPLPPVPEPVQQVPAMAEMEINDSVQVQVEMAINDAFKTVEIPMAVPQPSATSDLPAVDAPTNSQTTEKEKEKKVKRKFSLKRLKERFLSGPSPASSEAQDIPPVPALPPTILMALPTSGPVDPPFTPPPIPTDPTFSSPSLASSGPIDPPFTPPPMPAYDFPASSEDNVPKEPMTTTIATKSTVPPLHTADEDSNISTSSEDSGSSAASSSPDSTQPDTADSVRDGPVFRLLQGKGKDAGAKASSDGPDVVKIQSESAETGIKRSSGMRRQLDSLRFADLGFVPVAA